MGHGMSILGIGSSSPYSYQPLANKSGGSSGTSGAQQSSSSGDSTVQDFLDYMKESPAQRMFDNFLSAHHISKEEWNAMTPAQKQKIIDEFKHEMEDKMKQKLGANTATSGSGGVNIVA
jgi:predicted flavoprotein YhiN